MKNEVPLGCRMMFSSAADAGVVDSSADCKVEGSDPVEAKRRKDHRRCDGEVISPVVRHINVECSIVKRSSRAIQYVA